LEAHVSRVGAAEYLGISRETLRRIVRRGELTPIRVSPRRVVFDPGELRRYVEERKA
jgi:excisionase family DNA binding protein